MIKENELKIGSILNYLTAEGDICTATIDWQGLKWLNEDPKGFNMVHSVIELTPEWLINFGFIYCKFSLSSLDRIDNYSKNRKIELTFENGEIKSVYVGVQRIDDGKRIKYVHQLQNLYFALTGEELELNQH